MSGHHDDIKDYDDVNHTVNDDVEEYDDEDWILSSRHTFTEIKVPFIKQFSIEAHLENIFTCDGKLSVCLLRNAERIMEMCVNVGPARW